MGAPQYEQAGADIGGTGTTNTIPRWTGPSTLGDSVITQDTNARAIGVATASLAPWGSAYRAIQIGQSAAIMSAAAAANDAWYVSNGYWDGSVFRYTATGPALAYSQASTGHRWIYAASGTAGTAFSFTDGMILNTSGNVGIGTASPGRKLEISAAAPLRMGTGGEYFDFLQYTPGTWAWLSSAGQYVASWKTSGGMGFGGIVAPASNTVDVSTASWGLKLPATPGNADTQTLDAYQEMGSGTYVASTATLTCGTSGTITLKTTSDQNKLYVTRIGRVVHVSGYLVVDSVSAPTGRLTITTSPALPSVQTGANATIVFTGSTGLAAGNVILCTLSASTIFCDVFDGGTQSLTGAEKVQANTSLWVSFSYHAA